jgi:putative transposase
MRDRQDALRQRLRELAAVRVRFGYRRLTTLLRREGWPVNAKRIYRLYALEGLAVRTKRRKKLASGVRVALPAATRPNERWSMDFVSARLADGRWFRMLTVIDLYTREFLALVADRSLTGIKVAATLSHVLRRRPAPLAITVDNGGEFVSRAMDAWAYAHGVRLDFIRPGKERLHNVSAALACSARYYTFRMHERRGPTRSYPRLTQPLVRDNRGLRPATWDEALGSRRPFALQLGVRVHF